MPDMHDFWSVVTWYMYCVYCSRNCVIVQYNQKIVFNSIDVAFAMLRGTNV